MVIFAETAGVARRQGIKNIKTGLCTGDIILYSGYSLHNWLFDRDFSKGNRTYKEFLIGMIKPPFIPEEKEDDYLSAEYCFEDRENGIEKSECQGLAAAYISNTLSISFQNGPAWSKPELAVAVTGENGCFGVKLVRNVFSPGDFNMIAVHCFVAGKLLEEMGDRYLRQTELLPWQKECRISDDHGKDKLIKFW
jgi:hypothetical protein